MFVYVNGDSYAIVPQGKSYAYFLAQHFSCGHKNAAISGSCNSRILRTSLRHLMDLVKVHDTIIAVISLSFVMRTELWDPEVKNTGNRFVDDGEFVSLIPTASMNWFTDRKISVPSQYRNYIQQWLQWYDVEAETVNLLKDILLFTTWCKYNKIRYFVLSGPPQESINFQSSFVKSYYDTVMEDPMIMDLFRSSFTDWCVSHGHQPVDDYTAQIHGKTHVIGHHNEQAHKHFAQFLVENYLGK